MRVHQFLFICEFFLFSLVSLSSVNVLHSECEELTNKSNENIRFSSFSGSRPKSCSICSSALKEGDLLRNKCDHGYHAMCLQDCFIHFRPVSQHQLCRDCLSNDHYHLFLAFVIFDAPELPDGLKYVPELLNETSRLILWRHALKQKDPEAMKRFLKFGMSADPIQTPKGAAKLCDVAAAIATPETLQVLLESGIIPKKDITMGFGSAIAALNFPNATVFLKCGANIDQLYMAGNGDIKRTLLSIAIIKEKVEIVKYLIENKANVNLAGAKDDSPIHLAISMDNWEIVDILMKTREIDLNIKSKEKHLPIHNAALQGKLNALRALLDNKSNISDFFTVEGFSLLQFTAGMGPIESVKLLIDRGFMPRSMDGSIKYGLHVAVFNDKIETVKFLLEYGANPNEEMSLSTLNYFQRKPNFTYSNSITTTDSPVIFAVYKKNYIAVELFLNAGVNPNIRVFGSSASILHLACILGHVEIAGLLIERGADIDSLDKNGRSPFSYASQEFYKEVVKSLSF